MDRHNLFVFMGCCCLVYFAAPVTYVGVVHAALLTKLGAAQTISNLPESAYLVGSIGPMIVASFIPHRIERSVLVLCNTLSAISLGVIGVILVSPAPNSVKTFAIIAQGLLLGFLFSVGGVYSWQCLRRGTTPQGRARTLRAAYTVGPICAVAGSLTAQLILNKRLFVLPYPYDFAALYAIGTLTIGGVAALVSRYQLIEVPEEIRASFLQDMLETLKGFARDRFLLTLWVAYLLWTFAMETMTNLSLYSKVTIGCDPKELSGIILATRFACKCMSGFVLGSLALRVGVRAPLVACTLFACTGVVWGWALPGYMYLLAFGFMGAGELGGVYFPNYLVTRSSMASSARNLALLSLVVPLSGLAPALHGALAQWLGFPASFAFGCTSALVALWFVLRLAPQTVGGGR